MNDELDAMDEMNRDLACEYAGHDWAPAGGGLLICTQCRSEKWDDALPPRGPQPRDCVHYWEPTSDLWGLRCRHCGLAQTVQP